jgi:hypothetical protein
MIPKVVIKWNIHLDLIILNHFLFRRNYLAVVTSQYFLFKNLIKGYHKSLVFLRI